MNKGVMAKFVGVFVSLLVIWKINDVMLITPCIEQGGVFKFEKGQCILSDGSLYTTGFEMPLVILYVVIGFSVSYFISKLIRKVFKSE
ncbi:hypothetical protein [Colwellia sp. UCD-KL20]|uniref:hypothetical protein n=1 Tax=Colwellia sp. UCD-KL20 TaxID=1917165 RepID=UPI000970A9E3|nr:hypothetical protein [Colwellia sp. UCD-KL20]